MRLSGFRYEKEMQAAVIAWLRAQGFICTRELCTPNYNPMDIVGGRFGQRIGRRVPPLLEAVAVELKMIDSGGVLKQAINNRRFVERSFAAMPAERCAKLNRKSTERFISEGVGLLAVAEDYVVEMIPATRSIGTNEHTYKNLWRKLRRELGPELLNERHPGI